MRIFQQLSNYSQAHLTQKIKLVVFQNIFVFKIKLIFLPKMLEVHKVPVTKMAKFFFQVRVF